MDEILSEVFFSIPYTGPIKVNQKMAILRFDLENEISVCVRNWEIENPDSWLLSNKAIIN